MLTALAFLSTPKTNSNYLQALLLLDANTKVVLGTKQFKEYA
jgi:hypothetical protein